MAAGSFQFTVGAGSYQHTYSYTRGGVTGHAPYVLLGDQMEPTYSVPAPGVALATAASHLLQIMAGSTLNVRIKRILLVNLTAPAAVAIGQIQLWRLTTAGTGGTAITPSKFDNGAAASGATAMTLPTVKGTEGVQLYERAMFYGTAAIPTGALGMWEWTQLPGEQPITIPAGTANGLAIKNVGALATATVSMTVEFMEVNF